MLWESGLGWYWKLSPVRNWPINCWISGGCWLNTGLSDWSRVPLRIHKLSLSCSYYNGTIQSWSKLPTSLLQSESFSFDQKKQFGFGRSMKVLSLQMGWCSIIRFHWHWLGHHSSLVFLWSWDRREFGSCKCFWPCITCSKSWNSKLCCSLSRIDWQVNPVAKHLSWNHMQSSK